ncbi:unnamed protein product [Prorocentrum cordatum]|uniref:PDZ domain-containing protein n=1 Tax=Prorocentrum cordatum TaxID=2364126 RepID=A0ABN9UYE8_9DINO|nr:unnamed protein product [Polarella glacialis]
MRQAYQLELERQGLLREQLEAKGSVVDAPACLPDEGGVDWFQMYTSIAAANAALEEQLVALSDGEKDYEDMRDVAANTPVIFKIQLPQQELEDSIELVRYFGKCAAFYLVQASMPLGLQLTKKYSGDLAGAFVVEKVIPGGSAAASGNILPGDVLQALTIATEGYDRSGWTDVMSSFVGGTQGGSWRQTLADASLIGSLDELVDAMKGNSACGPDVGLTLILQRNTATGPAPAVVLQPCTEDGATPLPTAPTSMPPLRPP